MRGGGRRERGKGTERKEGSSIKLYHKDPKELCIVYGSIPSVY